MDNTIEIDWEEKERQMDEEAKAKKKEYNRNYQRIYMTKKRQEKGVLYTRGKYLSPYDKIKAGVEN